MNCVFQYVCICVSCLAHSENAPKSNADFHIYFYLHYYIWNSWKLIPIRKVYEHDNQKAIRKNELGTLSISLPFRILDVLVRVYTTYCYATKACMHACLQSIEEFLTSFISHRNASEVNSHNTIIWICNTFQWIWASNSSFSNKCKIPNSVEFIFSKSKWIYYEQMQYETHTWQYSITQSNMCTEQHSLRHSIPDNWLILNCGHRIAMHIMVIPSFACTAHIASNRKCFNSTDDAQHQSGL